MPRDHLRPEWGVDVVARDGAVEAALAEPQAFAHAGAWALDLASESAVWLAETYRILGVNPATFKPSQKSAAARIHPDDQEIAS